MYALRDLAPHQVTHLERHVAACPHCRSELREMERLVVALRGLARGALQRAHSV